MPNFNFDLTLYGGDIGFLPGLEAWITTVIKDSVLRSPCLSKCYAPAVLYILENTHPYISPCDESLIHKFACHN